jgi:hypothetical protein
LFVGTNGIALIIGSQIVGCIADIISERAVLKIGLLMSNLSGTVLLVALLVKATLLAKIIDGISYTKITENVQTFENLICEGFFMNPKEQIEYELRITRVLTGTSFIGDRIKWKWKVYTIFMWKVLTFPSLLKY